LDQCPGLALLLDLAVDELDDVRMVGIEDHHLGRPASLAAGLDHAGEGVKALHKGDRAGCRAAAREELTRGTKWREIRAGTRAVLEEHALGLGQGEDRLHPVLDLIDKASRKLRALLD